MATIKQKLVASKLVENGGNVGKAMIDAGYSRAMAKNPQKLTRSKGWQELMEKYISDEAVIKAHRDLLDSVEMKCMTFPLSEDDKEIEEVLSSIEGNRFIGVQKSKRHKTVFYTVPDYSSILKALYLAYKIKGKFSPEKIESEVKVIPILSGISKGS